jgi:membrane protein required for beta-lactamase induction
MRLRSEQISEVLGSVVLQSFGRFLGASLFYLLVNGLIVALIRFALGNVGTLSGTPNVSDHATTH